MMNPFLSFFIKTFISIPVFFFAWLMSFFVFHQSGLISTGISIAGVVLVFWFTSAYIKHHFLKRNGLTRKEYRYIKKNLDEAKQKIIRLRKALLSIRHIPSFKQRVEFLKVSNKIYRLTKKEPKRFFLAEPFYFSHLDSALELSEKYVFLSIQPKKTLELDQSLHEALETLEELSGLVEKDLYAVISDDIEKLDYEIDVARNTLKKNKSHIH